MENYQPLIKLLSLTDTTPSAARGALQTRSAHRRGFAPEPASWSAVRQHTAFPTDNSQRLLGLGG